MATRDRILALAVGEEYPVTLDDGTAIVWRKSANEWNVALSLVSHPVGVWEGNETFDNPESAIGAVEALL